MEYGVIQYTYYIYIRFRHISIRIPYTHIATHATHKI